MHQSSFDLMESLLLRLAPIAPGSRVLDCGAAIAGTGMQVSYRDLVPANVQYVGFDASTNRNVDIVGDIYDPIEGIDGADVVISGQMLEHLTFPLVAAQVMKKIVHPGGWMILIAPWQYGIHRYPLDCWRVLPDGMEFLFEGFNDVETGVLGNDCYGIGRKPLNYVTPWTISRS